MCILNLDFFIFFTFLSKKSWVSQRWIYIAYLYYTKGVVWFPLLLFICIEFSSLRNTTLYPWEHIFSKINQIRIVFVNLPHIGIVFVNLVAKTNCISLCRRREREKSEKHQGLLPQSCCCHRATNEKKTAAWISSAAEGKMRAQQRL